MWLMRRTHDAELIRSFITNPAIWPHVTEDDAGPAENWQPALAPHIHWLIADDGGALFMVYPLLPRLWEAHSQVLPEFREHTKNYYEQVREYLRRNTLCGCLLGLIPDGNYKAKRAAEAAGMTALGAVSNCWLKGSRKSGMTIYKLEI